ncbi:caspase family protein [Amycolatopsis sp. MtRt-6]|uniref:caspase family protein n=1 Tax=Amycolatopsis sp. MtRt-6 TaxID=2792782 RepID=UPI001F5D0976|nr:caspase family protein [Amycolatopsis sp. MtRt-6]
MAGRRRALIVANGEYDNAGLQRLGSPAADADALAAVLGDRAISDFEVCVVRNETAHVVQAEIEDLCAEGRPDDVLLMHFSCHGLKDDSGGLYFAARNTRPDRLRSTAVPAQFVQQCIRQSRSRSIVLLLDCCYGGAFGQGVAVRASGDANVLDSFRGGRGRAVITASNSIEYAFEGAKLASDEPAQPSVFTSALVEGLRTGEADRDEDGWIALGELYEYLFDRVRERNPKQTPSRDIEMQGELYLAKSRRRRIKPSPIPADLAAAIGAENPFTRLGAVAELRRRLSSPNLPVAVGAFEALRAMASTDIEHVAAAASEAMSSAVVRPDVESVRLSAPAGGSAAGSLRVLGPPVAREVRFEASHPWIAVTEVPGGAALAVTAGEAGVRRGKVVVSGPTGDAVVTVEIEALPVAEVEPGSAAGAGRAAAGAGSAVAAGPTPEPEPTAEREPKRGPQPDEVPRPAPARPGPEPADHPNVALVASDAPNVAGGGGGPPPPPRGAPPPGAAAAPPPMWVCWLLPPTGGGGGPPPPPPPHWGALPMPSLPPGPAPWIPSAGSPGSSRSPAPSSPWPDGR